MIAQHIIWKLLRTLLTLIYVALAGCHLATSPHPLQGRDTGKGAVIRFSYPNDKATSVCVIGDFNGWSTAADCLSGKKGGFILEKRLAPGRYKYQFVIDSGIKVLDPRATLSEDDGFGGKNSVLVVE